MLAALIAFAFLYADAALYRFLHDNFNENTRPVPQGMGLAHRLLRSLEDWGENVFIVVVLFAMWRLDTQRRSRVVCLIAAAALTSLTVEAIKRTSGRQRPDATQGVTVFKGPSWNENRDNQSFPSGHTASAAAYSGVLSAFYPPLKPAMIFLACGTGASRIWKERHFLSDCLVGGLIGWCLATWFAKGQRFEPWWRKLNVKFGGRVS